MYSIRYILGLAFVILVVLLIAPLVMSLGKRLRKWATEDVWDQPDEKLSDDE